MDSEVLTMHTMECFGVGYRPLNPKRPLYSFPKIDFSIENCISNATEVGRVKAFIFMRVKPKDRT
jgi:hypothetical protein